MNKTFTRPSGIGGSFMELLKNIFTFDIKNRITLTTSIVVMFLIILGLLVLLYGISELSLWYLPLVVFVSILGYLGADYIGYFIMRHNLAMYKIHFVSVEDDFLRASLLSGEQGDKILFSKIFKMTYQWRAILEVAGIFNFVSPSMRAFVIHYHDDENNEKEIKIPLDVKDLEQLLLVIVGRANLEITPGRDPLGIVNVWERTASPNIEKRDRIDPYTINPQSNIAIPFLIAVAIAVFVGYILISQGII